MLERIGRAGPSLRAERLGLGRAACGRCGKGRHMEVVFRCLRRGKRLFSVVSFGQELFVGTRGECARFLDIHNHKVLEQREEDLRPPRRRALVARSYRTSVKLHA